MNTPEEDGNNLIRHIVERVHLSEGKYLQVPYRVGSEDRVMLVNVYSITTGMRKAASMGVPAKEEKGPTWN